LTITLIVIEDKAAGLQKFRSSIIPKPTHTALYRMIKKSAPGYWLRFILFFVYIFHQSALRNYARWSGIACHKQAYNG
jgi:hypothetical protein